MVRLERTRILIERSICNAPVVRFSLLLLSLAGEKREEGGCVGVSRWVGESRWP